MYIKWGSYSFPKNEAQVAIQRHAHLSPSGLPTKYTHVWDIQGMMMGTPTALATEIAAIESAFASGAQDLVLYNDDNSATPHQLLTADTLSGTRVVRAVSYPTGMGAELATIRTYAVTVEGDISAVSGDTLVHWAESVAVTGNGGANWDLVVPISGSPVAETFTAESVVTVVQRGQAVGIGAYPMPNTPLFSSQILNQEMHVERELPSFLDNRLVTSWTYTMRLASSAGTPTPTPP